MESKDEERYLVIPSCSFYNIRDYCYHDDGSEEIGIAPIKVDYGIYKPKPSSLQHDANIAKRILNDRKEESNVIEN